MIYTIIFALIAIDVAFFIYVGKGYERYYKNLPIEKRESLKKSI